MSKEVTYEEIARDLKNRNYKPIYYLMGEESYYIDKISEYISQTVLTDEEKEFNLTVMYGADTDIASIINAAKRYPMMSEYQVVIVKEAQLIKETDALLAYLKNPQPTTVLVFAHKNGSI
ncbi:MAG: DNA polymerase III subunit delta, partial [Bacteroidaceae bacterium]|nr:DNA polymerase III subunit delta [Bacteroidaceae bacterium]